MTLKNALRKLEKNGLEVVNDNGRYSTELKNGLVLEILGNPTYGDNDEPEVATIGIRNANDKSDMMTDYCALTFYDNLTQALDGNI